MNNFLLFKISVLQNFQKKTVTVEPAETNPVIYLLSEPSQSRAPRVQRGTKKDEMSKCRKSISKKNDNVIINICQLCST